MKVSKLRNLKAAQGGFTLIELLVVIGILAILLAITLIAINPNKHFKDSRNTQRSSNVSEILNAIYEYESANNGNQPTAVSKVTSAAESLQKAVAISATTTAFSTPNLTFTVPGGNTVTSGTITVASCTDPGNNGMFHVTSGSGTTIVVSNTAGVASDTTCVITPGVDLCTELAPTYIADLPTDPTSGLVTGGSTPCAGGTTSYNTGYTIAQSSGRFTIAAPAAEGTTISVTR